MSDERHKIPKRHTICSIWRIQSHNLFQLSHRLWNPSQMNLKPLKSTVWNGPFRAVGMRLWWWQKLQLISAPFPLPPPPFPQMTVSNNNNNNPNCLHLHRPSQMKDRWVATRRPLNRSMEDEAAVTVPVSGPRHRPPQPPSRRHPIAIITQEISPFRGEH